MQKYEFSYNKKLLIVLLLLTTSANLYVRNISKEIAICNIFQNISKIISKYFNFEIFFEIFQNNKFRNISKNISKYFENVFEIFRNTVRPL